MRNGLNFWKAIRVTMDDLYYTSYSEGKPDADTIRFITAIAAAGLPPVSELTPEMARQRNMVRAFSIKAEPIGKVHDKVIPGPYGDIPFRIYTPEGDGPFPLLLYMHGGGWVVGTLNDFDSVCRLLCAGSGYMVVSVDYQLAPEAKFPVAIEEGYTVLKWISDQAPSMGADPGRIAVGGDSAGATMAAVLALMARDRKGPDLFFQLLICPATNLSQMDTSSYNSFSKGIWLSEEMMDWYIDHYLSKPEEANNPYVSPLLESDLSKLPPAFILTAEFDVLRDEAEEYAKRLQQAGVEVKWKRYTGQIHDFVIFGKVLYKAKEALNDCCVELRNYGNTVIQ